MTDTLYLLGATDLCRIEMRHDKRKLTDDEIDMLIANLREYRQLYLDEMNRANDLARDADEAFDEGYKQAIAEMGK